MYIPLRPGGDPHLRPLGGVGDGLEAGGPLKGRGALAAGAGDLLDAGDLLLVAVLGARGGGDAGGLEAVGEAAAGLAADLVAGAHFGWLGGCVCIYVYVWLCLLLVSFSRVRGRCIIGDDADLVLRSIGERRPF